MAPARKATGTKRAASAAPPASAPAQKVAKAAASEVIVEAKPIDGVLDALRQSSLPSACKGMLLAIAPAAFQHPSEQRCSFQEQAVKMVVEVVDAERAKLEEALDKETSFIADFETRRAELEATVATAESDRDLAQQEVELKQQALAEASKALIGYKQHAINAMELRAQIEGTIKTMKSDQEEFHAAFDEHFSILRDTSLEQSVARSHYQAFSPLIAKVCFEDSLLTALPSSLCRAPELRGGFDKIVVTEIESTLRKYSADLDAKLEAAGPSLAEAVSSTCAADEEVVAATSAVRAAGDTVRDAQANLAGKRDAVKLAKQAVDRFMDHYKVATSARDQKTSALKRFDEFNIASLNALMGIIAPKTTSEAVVVASATPDAVPEGSSGLQAMKTVASPVRGDALVAGVAGA